MNKKFSTIESAITQLKSGGLIIISDDENRENEGDFLGLADYITPDSINFMIKEGRGLVCIPVSEEIADRLNLVQMVDNNTESSKTAFTVSIDGAFESTGVTTGISAFDRAATIKQIANPNSTTKDFVYPGHMFPLVAKDNGVLERNGHTEAAIDLARLANSTPAGVICEIINSDGTMSRQDDLFALSQKHNLPFITIESLVEHIRSLENYNKEMIAG
ncbi:3,4-dihydroxy-2-butanone-4-phosphate synthase [Carnobacterium maltaromaticum]|uniref:3,4-dihydroxy-2-butanone-4-phosphate synthase n=1 Tax=Carnobacterium maltaromaticum TaxID=2751 RepID=UPI00295F3DB4|nr:3,4-dihydroxy-2-butanone-4-phosphate synthase [Carnobacterium maltaromaticum]